MKLHRCLVGAIIGGSVAFAGCAGSQTEPEVASNSETDDEPWKAVEQDPSDLPQGRAANDTEGGESSGDAGTGEGEPNFTPGMSVLEATNAVPASAERLNIEQERLAEPLMKPELYEPCSLQGHHHFTVKVAVWDGRAVGLDVSTKPNDEKLSSCIRQQITGIEWDDKAKSLNTVEYTY